MPSTINGSTETYVTALLRREEQLAHHDFMARTYGICTLGGCDECSVPRGTFRKPFTAADFDYSNEADAQGVTMFELIHGGRR